MAVHVVGKGRAGQPSISRGHQHCCSHTAPCPAAQPAPPHTTMPCCPTLPCPAATHSDLRATMTMLSCGMSYRCCTEGVGDERESRVGSRRHGIS